MPPPTLQYLLIILMLYSTNNYCISNNYKYKNNKNKNKKHNNGKNDTDRIVLKYYCV